MCLGAGCLALYQTVRYRGMKMITTAHADIAHIVNVAGTTHDWNLFDQTGKYNQKNVYELVKRLGIESDFADIKPEEKMALIDIKRFMARCSLTSAHALQIVQGASSFQENICQQGLMNQGRLCADIKRHLIQAYGMKIKEVNIHTDRVYGQRYYDNFCLKAHMYDNTVIPVPTHVLACVLNDAELEVPSMGKSVYKEPKKIGRHKAAGIDSSITKKTEDGLRDIQSLMSACGLTTQSALAILIETYEFHKSLSLMVEGAGLESALLDQIRDFMNAESAIGLEVVYVEGGPFGIRPPFCFRGKTKDGLSRPIPLSVLTYVVQNSLKLELPMPKIVRWGKD
jgi:hypothetical protein